MRYIGVDPGPNDHAFAVIDDGWLADAFNGAKLDNHPGTDTTVCIEHPVPQGRPWGWDIHATHERVIIFRYRLWLSTNYKIYSVPSNTARAHVTGWYPSKGKFDPFCNRWIKKMKIKTGKGELLNSAHRRDAFIMALWGERVAHTAQGQEYLYEGEHD